MNDFVWSCVFMLADMYLFKPFNVKDTFAQTHEWKTIDGALVTPGLICGEEGTHLVNARQYIRKFPDFLKS